MTSCHVAEEGCTLSHTFRMQSIVMRRQGGRNGFWWWQKGHKAVCSHLNRPGTRRGDAGPQAHFYSVQSPSLQDGATQNQANLSPFSYPLGKPQQTPFSSCASFTPKGLDGPTRLIIAISHHTGSFCAAWLVSLPQFHRPQCWDNRREPACLAVKDDDTPHSDSLVHSLRTREL